MRKFSPSWIASIKPKKQRKFRANAPLHTRAKMMAIHLSKELCAKHKKRNVVARVGDKVKIIKGDHKSKEGKIERVDRKEYVLYIEGIERQKRDGNKAKIAIAPSNVIAIELALDDKRRVESIQRK